MATATIEQIDTSSLSIEETYALAILQNLAVEQVDQIKQLLKLGRPGVIGPGTLSAFMRLCQKQGIDLSAAGVSAFKDQHHLKNTGTYQGVIGPQTAGVYFNEIVGQGGSHTASPGNYNQAILTAAQSLMGMCTNDGPDGGNNACAWSVNQVLRKAGISPLGENPNYVPSLLEALQGGRGQLISRPEAKAGDLVIANGEAHIGIGLDDSCNTVLSNSSSRARFQWQSDTDFDGYYGGPSTIYRLIQ